MKGLLYFLILISLVAGRYANCQDVGFFLKEHNDHIAGESIFDTIVSMKQVRHYKLTDPFTHLPHDFVTSCIYSVAYNEECQCLENYGGTTLNDPTDSKYFHFVENDRKIKYELSYIFYKGKEENFSFLYQDDSVTIIKEVFDAVNIKEYYFGTHSKDLLRLKNITAYPEGDFVRLTDFLSYQRFFDVLVPTEIKFTSKIFNGSILLLDVEFNSSKK